MAFEVELKARLVDPVTVEGKAAALGTFVKESFKEDIYFRRKGNSQRVPAERYRLRREAGRAVVTFKKKIEMDGVDVNDEVEFTVDNAHAFFRFADAFGFEPFVVKRKRSRIYKVERVSVEINEVEHLGHFTELEILCEAEAYVPAARTEIARLLNKLGLTSEDLEPNFYIVMLQDAYPARYRFINDPRLDWPFEEVLP